MAQISFTQDDEAFFRQVALDLHDNRLAPLTQASSWDATSRTMLPLGAVLLIGLGMLSVASLPRTGEMAWIAPQDLRLGTAFVAVLFLVTTVVTVIGRIYAAKDALSIWSWRNGLIMDRAYGWVLEKSRDDLLLLAPLLTKARDAAGAKAAPLEKDLNEFRTDTAIQTYQASFRTLTALLVHPEVVNPGITLDPANPYWVARGQILERARILGEFMKTTSLPHMLRSRRAFLLSFFSVELLMIPLAAGVLIRAALD